jgi:hypothetical protein
VETGRTSECARTMGLSTSMLRADSFSDLRRYRNG